MKLDRIEIKNYRSLFADSADKPFEMTLGDGMNAITGPNNVGKSNVFRALALALDPDARFDRAADMPSVWPWSKPTVTLTFHVPERGRAPRESTLLRYLDAYEREVNPEVRRTYADEGLVKLRVTIEGGEGTMGTRRESFVVRGGGARALAAGDDVSRRALEQFHQCLHFVLISSGQSLDSLMEGKFRDILRNVLLDDLRQEFRAAEASRARFEDDLRSGLLQSLAGRISDEVKDLFPEILGVSLDPQVLTLEETLAKMRVRVSDVAVTDLADKGTGVRGGLIVAMLRHFADVGRRSMLFAVEEPESFLHPAAQEQLRDDLEALAIRRDVSLLVSTHSPYIVSRTPESKVFALGKERSGRTVLAEEATGEDPHAGVMGGLFRDRLFVEWFDQAVSAPPDGALVLVVEGCTDQAFAEHALRTAGRDDLLDGIVFRLAGAGQTQGTGGANLAVMQAVLARATSTNSVKVAVLLDNDAPGREALQMLRAIGTKTGDWKEGRTVFTYRSAFRDGPKDFPFEAEGLWPDHLGDSFIAKHAGKGWLRSKTKLPRSDPGYQFDWEVEAKEPFLGHVRQHARAQDCERWVRLFEAIRAGTGFDTERQAGASAAPQLERPRGHVSDRGSRRDLDQVAFVREVLERARPQLETAGAQRLRMHTRGAYIEMRLPKGSGLAAADGHLLIRVTAKDAKVVLVLHGLPSRRENLAALTIVRDHYAADLARPDAPDVDSWSAGVGSALRSYASSVLPGGGRDSGSPATTADWAAAQCEAWMRMLTSRPITGLEAKVRALVGD